MTTNTDGSSEKYLTQIIHPTALRPELQRLQVPTASRFRGTAKPQDRCKDIQIIIWCGLFSNRECWFSSYRKRKALLGQTIPKECGVFDGLSVAEEVCPFRFRLVGHATDRASATGCAGHFRVRRFFVPEELEIGSNCRPLHCLGLRNPIETVRIFPYASNECILISWDSTPGIRHIADEKVMSSFT